MRDLAYIDDYFQGKLLPEEKAIFEQQIIDDPTFAKEVAFYSSAMLVSKEQAVSDKKKWFREIYEQNSNAITPVETVRRPLVRKLWPVLSAAAVVIALIVGIYLFAKPGSPQQLAEKYVQKDLATLGIRMGGIQDSIQFALSLYNNGKLAEALQKFESIVRADTEQIDAIKYAGIVSLRLKNYDRALYYFARLENYPGLQSNPGKFYHALVLMLRNEPGDKMEARQLLRDVVDQKLEEEATAKNWLEKW